MKNDIQSTTDGKPLVRTVRDAEPPALVMDLGERENRVDTDVIGDTLIVVDESTGEQYEYSLPGEHRRTFMQNGILTIEVEE